jgi:YVTN family beta-propeller protein
VAITPDGGFAYITNNGDGTVSVIDTTANIVVKTIAVGSFPDGVAFTRGGDFAYVCNTGSGSFSVIDTDTYTVTTITLPAGSRPDSLAFTANGKAAYMTNQNDPGSIWVIDTTTNLIADTITVGVRSLPSGVAISRRRREESHEE